MNIIDRIIKSFSHQPKYKGIQQLTNTITHYEGLKRKVNVAQTAEIMAIVADLYHQDPLSVEKVLHKSGVDRAKRGVSKVK